MKLQYTTDLVNWVRVQAMGRGIAFTSLSPTFFHSELSGLAAVS